MPIEKAIVAQARPYMLATRSKLILQSEMNKGGQPEIFSNPVALEPMYEPISNVSELLVDRPRENHIHEISPDPKEMLRLHVWLSPDEPFNWLHSELFLKQLRSISHRVGFEIIGNETRVHMGFLVHQRDLPILMTAFKGLFERCELSVNSDNPMTEISLDLWNSAEFIDCFPPPPYSHLLTSPGELKISTYPSLIASLMSIRAPNIGFYQALFQPANLDHNWHQNVEKLLDLEFVIKLHTEIRMPQRYYQQAPSGDLRHMAMDVETKAHSDKPFFFAALRLGVISSERSRSYHLKSMETFINLFHHGGQALRYVTDKNYREIHSPDTIRDMFLYGLTYRPGFLVNSSELTGPVHIPPANILDYRNPPIILLETLPVRNSDLHEGTPIGKCRYAGIEVPVCIPPKVRERSTHIIGRSGQRKSTTMAHMVLDDIEKGMGAAVIDPHGDLIEALLGLIDKKHLNRTIYFDQGIPDYIPIWNPLKRTISQDVSRTADDLVAALKTVVTGWGDRMEHLLRNGFYALLQLPGSTLLDLSDLLRRKSDESDRLREKILETIDNHTARLFWKKDFDRYSNEALDPPKHKLSKLLVSGNISLMLSQPESYIDFRKIMDNGNIILINLSTVGPDVREILGCFILSLFHLSALSRSDIPIQKRRPFNIYVDEAHRFITDAMEDLIAETRKFGANLTLAHHYLSQFGNKKIDALSSVGTTVIMNVDGKDARYLSKDLRGLVQYEDMINLQVDEAIARIDTDIVRLKKLGPLEVPSKNYKEQIIRHSLERYYKPASAIKQYLQCKGRPGLYPKIQTLGQGKSTEEFIYDEF